MDTLTVREAAEFTGLSAHTLRYYERAGLLTPVARAANGHRRYATPDLDHLRFLHCLRETGMSIRGMQDYAALAAHGHETLELRIELLQAHRRETETRLLEIQRLLSVIDTKIQRLQQGSLNGIPGTNTPDNAAPIAQPEVA